MIHMYTIDPDQKNHHRLRYSLFDLFGDFGGLLEFVMVFGMILMSPLTEF